MDNSGKVTGESFTALDFAHRLDVLCHSSGSVRWYQWDVTKLEDSYVGQLLWNVTQSLSVFRRSFFSFDANHAEELLSQLRVCKDVDPSIQELFSEALGNIEQLALPKEIQTIVGESSIKFLKGDAPLGPTETFLSDYKAPAYLIPDTKLVLDIHEGYTDVTSTITLKKNTSEWEPLVLTGEDLELLSVELNGKQLGKCEYIIENNDLKIFTIPEEGEAIVSIKTRIYPENNKALSGLYQSRGIYCTQCESEGFRRITYFLDRPDVLSRYECTVIADQETCPVVLSNGNEIARELLPEGRHKVTFEDPFPKPSYLFAAVAGNLAVKEDHFTTKSGREVLLRAFVEQGNETQVDFALDALKRSMKWDEEKFGREYDLDILNMVAVNDFNAGAMENKGLLVFNSSCFLVDPNLTSDRSIEFVEACVGHEYFHNWTGNRVTCRDWFQLCLKEGLTNFREQEFCADENSRDVKRIKDVRGLRNSQFVEDAGPNAHPIQPSSYVNISNFYTATVYNKGAEIYRMLQNLLGIDGFRKGMDRYFDDFDGTAATLQDLIASMEKANEVDLEGFRNWTSQAGTPQLDVRMDYDADKEEVTLHLKQSCRATKESQHKKPFTFPVDLAFFTESGEEMAVIDANGNEVKSTMLKVSEEEHSFVFKGVKSKPIPSLLRSFSAPVKLNYDYTIPELCTLFASDTDGFNRYEAGQRIAHQVLGDWMQNPSSDQSISFYVDILLSFNKILEDPSLEAAFRSLALQLPTVTEIVERNENYDFSRAHEQRLRFMRVLAQCYENVFLQLYQEQHTISKGSEISSDIRGARSLKNTALSYLACIEDGRYTKLVQSQYYKAENMTDRYHALSLLCNIGGEVKEAALKDFYENFQDSPEAMELWFSAQAASSQENLVEDMEKLEKHPAFDLHNPNKVRALYRMFTANLYQFHEPSGKGYRLLADKIIEIDRFNSSVAAGLATGFKKYPQLDTERKLIMKKHLERILHSKGISENVHEIIANTLKAGE